MTASKEISRPTSQHRPSLASSSSSVPKSASRSHSASLGALNPAHRISRRKSSSFAPGANAAAIEAAVESAVADGSATAVNRRSSMSKAALAALNDGVPRSLPHRISVPDGSALVDGPSLASFSAAADKAKQRRRASDGARLSSHKHKHIPGDLKCEHCGKAYKHGSCLSKHLWEHTPQWQYTSKLLISKHQQVQLLEAASVLVAMNQDGTGNDSDNSPSPAASGSSDLREDEASSTETTPPPQHEHAYRDSKRYSNSSSTYSRSYQSIFSSGSAPRDTGFSTHSRQWSTSSNRPPTANTSIAESYPEEDPADLAAAVGLLSCSYGTPKSGPTYLSGDVPPVPPLPAKYQDASAARSSHRSRHNQNDVDMDDDGTSDDDRIPKHDDAEYGMFGMEA